MRKADPAVSPEEKERFARLKRVVPAKTPQGWIANGEEPVRLNDYAQPGIFMRMYSNGFLKLVYLIQPSGELAVSLSNRNGSVPTADHVEAVKKAFLYKIPKVEVLPPRDGLIYFALEWPHT
jgi:hypothetical protein